MKEIQLSKRGYKHRGKYVALVDDADYDRVEQHGWSAHRKNGMVYAGRKVGDRTVYLHHVIIGNPPAGQVVDHRDRNGLNNQRHNLRFVTYLGNQHNRGVGVNNTSGTTGVMWDKANQKWMAQITVNYKQIKLGRFSDIEDARKARRAAELRYFPERGTSHE